LKKPKRFLKTAVKILPHPPLSPGIGGEGKGEGEIRSDVPKGLGNRQGLRISAFGPAIYATFREICDFPFRGKGTG
jgi:hypothetical protein